MGAEKSGYASGPLFDVMCRMTRKRSGIDVWVEIGTSAIADASTSVAASASIVASAGAGASV